MIPAGEPERLLGDIREFEGVAADMAEIRVSLHGWVTAVGGPGGWEGVAATAFARHMTGRTTACGLAEQALSGSALALREYAGRLTSAQRATRAAQAQACAAGLRLAGDQVDPTSLLPPDATKVQCLASLERQLLESEIEGLWASTQVVGALESAQQLALQAEHALGDQSGLSPVGFVSDLGRGALTYFHELGLGILEPLSALGMAALGNPRGIGELEVGLERTIAYARAHPDEAIAALLAADEAQRAIDSGHPGTAAGIGLALLATVLNPEGGDESAAARALAKQRFLERLDDVAVDTSFDHLPNVERAVVDPRKFQDYSMRAEHRENRGKWQAWANMGYDIGTPADRQAATRDVISQLNAQLPDVKATLTQRTPHGTTFEVKSEIVGPNGRHGTLVTLWQFDNGSDAPRLVTNWVALHR
jgi:hypothetical protein